jgi:hypothetical protein
MGLAISLAVYLDRRTLAQNHLFLGNQEFRFGVEQNQGFRDAISGRFLGKD